MKEVWKGLIYQGKDLSQWYEVSNFARVRNSKTKSVLKTRMCSTKYIGFMGCLGSRKCRKSIMVHKAVAETFIENKLNLPQVNHKDGVKTHNWVENLEWVTNQGNAEHASTHRLLKVMCGENHKNAKLTNEQAKEIKKLYATGKYTQKQIAEVYKISRAKISQITRGKAYNDTYQIHCSA